MVNFSLEGKVALVTGAAYGIGFAMAQALAEAGAKIAFNCRSQANMDKALEDYKAIGIDAKGYICDATDEEGVKAMVADIEKTLGPVDILVNNAGIIKRIPMHEMPAEEFRQVIDIDLVAPYICAKAVLPGMMERKAGKIINVCSIVVYLPDKHTRMKLFDTPDNRCYITAPPASDSTEQDRIHVVGYQKLHPDEKYPKDGFPDVCLFQEHGGRYINEFQLLYIASGTGTFQDRGIHYSLHAGHFILIQPGFWHSYSPNKETGWEEYYIGFNGPILSSLAHELYKTNDINLLRVNNTEFILPLFEAVLRTGSEETPDRQLMLKALLTQLITNIRFALKDSHSSKESLLFKARQFMEDNLSKKISIDDIAHHLGVSNSWFRREFYNETGVPPATYLGRVRLQTSKYILLSSEKSIKEIATECGFSTTEYFCKFFKDNTGMTPSEFREQGPQQHTSIWNNK